MLDEIKQHVIDLEERVHIMQLEMAAQNFIFYAVTMSSMLRSDDPEEYLNSIKLYADEVYDRAKHLPMADEMQANLDLKLSDLHNALLEHRKNPRSR